MEEITGIFILLFASLPGDVGIVKGISFAIIAWFFRVVMSVASNRMVFKVLVKALLYSLVAGLGEMLVLGMYGAFLKPWE